MPKILLFSIGETLKAIPINWVDCYSHIECLPSEFVCTSRIRYVTSTGSDSSAGLLVQPLLISRAKIVKYTHKYHHSILRAVRKVWKRAEKRNFPTEGETSFQSLRNGYFIW